MNPYFSCAKLLQPGISSAAPNRFCNSPKGDWQDVACANPRSPSRLVLWVLGQRAKRSRIKDTAYECGMLPVGQGSTRLSVKFYLVAMLFILFDIEVVFLYPWAVVYREMLQAHAGLILGSMLSFIAILLVGYVYAVRKNAFDWRS